MEIFLCIITSLCAVLIVINIVLIKKNRQSVELSGRDKKDIIEGFGNNVGVISQTISNAQKAGNDAIVDAVKSFKDSLLQEQNKLSESLIKSESDLENRILTLIGQLDKRMNEISKLQEYKLEHIRLNTQEQIKSMREDSTRQLESIRATVDEKLSKTINERFEQSFKVLSTQLESVYKSLGEMQTVAANVGNLTKVLSNVKTTGVFGEVRLGAILEQILTKDQYVTNFVTAGGKEPVEFAIKFPGQEENDFVYMPVDSKFPLTVYTDLCNAYENNDIVTVKLKREQLKNTVKSMARDIKTKYVNPPKTTDFAVMFLPVEGLFAEIAKMGLIDELQNTYKVTIAGPTTMSALLNSLQMGFRTLAIQKKSGEVWKVLGAVKTEFGKFNEIVRKIQDKFESTSKDFDALVGTRSRLIESKLKTVDKLDITDTDKILGIDGGEEIT